MISRKSAWFYTPVGVEDGQILRVQIDGQDIKVYIKLEGSDYFRKEGLNVHSDATISLSQALLGGSIVIKGLYDDEVVHIPPGTSSHSVINLKHKGWHKTYNKGDHLVHLKIEIPK